MSGYASSTALTLEPSSLRNFSRCGSEARRNTGCHSNGKTDRGRRRRKPRQASAECLPEPAQRFIDQRFLSKARSLTSGLQSLSTARTDEAISLNECLPRHSPAVVSNDEICSAELGQSADWKRSMNNRTQAIISDLSAMKCTSAISTLSSVCVRTTSDSPLTKSALRPADPDGCGTLIGLR